MNQKKIMSVVILLTLVLALVSLTFAQDENVQEVTDDTLEIAKDPAYAKYRIAGVLVALKEAVEKGYDVIDKIKEKDPQADTEYLANILSELEELIVQGASLENQEPSEELREKYVLLRERAKELVIEFRELAHEFIPSQEERAQIREEIRNRNREKIQAKRAEMEQKREEYKKGKLLEIYERLGFDDEDLKAKIESGQATQEELKKAAREAFEDMSNEEREALKAEREAKIAQNNAERQAMRETMKAEIEALRNDMKQKREVALNAFQERRANRANVGLGGRR